MPFGSLSNLTACIKWIWKKPRLFPFRTQHEFPLFPTDRLSCQTWFVKRYRTNYTYNGDFSKWGLPHCHCYMWYKTAKRGECLGHFIILRVVLCLRVYVHFDINGKIVKIICMHKSIRQSFNHHIQLWQCGTPRHWINWTSTCLNVLVKKC